MTDDLENEPCARKGPGRHHAHAEHLHEELLQPGMNIVDGGGGEHAHQQRTGEPAHAVGAPHFQGVVEVEFRLHAPGMVAHHGPGRPDDDGRPRRHIARAGRDGGKARHRAHEHAGEGGTA